MKEKIKIQNKGGRKRKVNPKTNRYVCRLTDEENAKFLALLDQSAMLNKAEFARKFIFENEIKILYYNKGAHDFYMKLTISIPNSGQSKPIIIK